MNLAGLSTDKAPPVDAPLRLFYLMPAFLALAGLVLLFQGDQVLASRWTPAALATTHFIVLGALAPVMCGALLQISPVLLGGAYPAVGMVARLTAGGLGLGSLLVGAGFLFTRPALLAAGGVAAASGLAVFLAASYVALASASGRRETVWAVRLSVLALAVTVALGLTLAAARLGWVVLPQHLRWVDTHVAWGLGGWVGLLLAGIGMEMIPLFYLSPAFATWLRRTLPFVVFALLAAISVAGIATPAAVSLPPLLVGAVFLAFLLYNAGALWLEHRRQRPRRDANLWLWQLSHVAVPAAACAWLAAAPPSLVGVLLLGGALSFVLGSLMKIVPFLNWLDLQQRRIARRSLHVTLPRLRALLPEARANTIALTLGGALAAVLAGAFVPDLSRLGGGLLIACALVFARALLGVARQRQAVLRQIEGSAPPDQ